MKISLPALLTAGLLWISLSAVTASAVVPLPSGAVVAATYTSGTVRAGELAMHGRLISSPYGDPWATIAGAPDPATRADAAAMAENSAREIVWAKDVAVRAAAEDFRLSDTLSAPIDAAREACAADLWRATVRSRVTTVTLAETRRAMAARPALFSQPESRDVSYIFRATAGTSEGRRLAISSEMADLAVRIRSGAVTFEEAARLNSEAPSAKDGGRLGPITRATRMNPRVMEFFFSAPVGQVSPPALLHNGYYIAFVQSAVTARSLTPDDVLTSPVLAEATLELLRDLELTSATAAARAAHPAAKSTVEALAAEAARMGIPTDACTTAAGLNRERTVAFSWYEERRGAAWDPTEAEIKAYYDSHPSEMSGAGIWKLTRYTVGMTTGARAAVRNLAAAREAAARVRADAATSPTLDALIAAHGAAGLITYSSLDWVNTTYDGPADRAILAIKPGGLTPVLDCTEGACFYRLDARRDPPAAPLDDRREVIRGALRTKKATAEMNADKAETAKRLGLQMIWPGGAKP